MSIQIADEVEACAAILYACRRADEITQESENAAFITTLKSRNLFIGHDVGAMLATTGRYFEEAGSSEALIVAAVPAVPAHLRLPLFYSALDVILANGLVTPHEHQVVQFLKARLHIEDDEAWKGMEVLLEKNKL